MLGVPNARKQASTYTKDMTKTHVSESRTYFCSFIAPQKQRKSQMFWTFRKKKKHLDPRSFERGPPQGFKSNPWVPLFCSPCSYAEAFLPPPLQKVVLLNMVSLFGSKAKIHVEMILKNGSPLQQISPKMLEIGVILFVIWETTWDTKLVSSAAATHAASKCFFVLDLKANQTAARINHRKAFKRSMCKNPWQHEDFQTTNNFCSFVSTWHSSNFDFDPVRFFKKKNILNGCASHQVSRS